MAGTLLIEQVRKGMKVFDSAGDHIGKVDFVQLPDPSAEWHGLGAAGEVSVGGAIIHEVGELADAGRGHLPPALEVRYRKAGYCRVDGKGWIDVDRFVTAEQIASISGGEVHLNVPKEDLLRA